MKTNLPKTLFLLAIVAAIFATACNKKNRKAEEVGTPYDKNAPTIKVNNEDKWRDTFKFNTNNFYTVEFSIKDDQKERQLGASKVENGLVLYKGNVLNNTSVDVSSVESGQLQFQALKPGFFSFVLTVKDPQGLASNAVVELNALENQLPVSILGLKQTNEVTPYQVKITGADSYDADARWGGKVMKYEYDIEGFYKTETVRNAIDFIFPKPGVYKVGLRVLDNDNAWSTQVTKLITVE